MAKKKGIKLISRRKRLISLFLTLLLLMNLALLSGCQNDQVVSLSIWHIYGNQIVSPLNEMIKEFNSTVGKENNIKISVTSVSNVNAIENEILAAVNDEPGAADLPDIFTAYTRIAKDVGTDKMLCWDDYFTEEELGRFVPDYITDGQIDGKLYVLPIAKAVDALFVNKTLFERYTGLAATEENLGTLQQIFAAADLYYDKTGNAMFQSNDFYLYFLNYISALGGNFLVDNKVDCYSKEFEQVFMPMAKSAIYGSVFVGDGYASDRWKTGEVIMHIGSTGDILYLRNYVTYSSNEREDIEIITLPYPKIDGCERTVTQSGVGLYTVKSEDERKNKAAAVFAKWLAETDNNLKLTTALGYAPVVEDAREVIIEGVDFIEKEEYRNMYRTIRDARSSSVVLNLPIFEGCSNVRQEFQKSVKSVLLTARAEYKSLDLENMSDEAKKSELNRLAEYALQLIQANTPRVADQSR